MDDMQSHKRNKSTSHTPIQPVHHSTCQSLPLSVQQALINNIVNQGGLKHFRLAIICNERPDLFGEPNTSRRRKVRNKVDRWKKLTNSKFDLLYENLNKRCDSNLLEENKSFKNDPTRGTNNAQTMSGYETPPLPIQLAAL